MTSRINALIAAYPAIAWAILGTLAALVVRYVPGMAGLDVDGVAGFLAAVITASTGVAIHRRVTPVSPEDRGL